jgi:hypothetical protein
MRIAKKLLILMLLLAAALASANHSVRVSGSSLFVNDLLVMTLRSGPASGHANRLSGVARGLGSIPATASISTRQNGRNHQVLANGEVVITALEAEARAHGKSTAALAQEWAQNLRRAINLPPIQFGKDTVRLPVGGREDVQLLGADAQSAKLEIADGAIAAASRSAGVIAITGRALGSTTVTLASPRARRTLTVSVLPSAAALPATLSATVVGNPASAETVKGAVEAAVWAGTQGQPNAQYNVELPNTESLAAERSVTVPVRVRASAPDAFPVEGTVSVTVRNMPLGHKAEAELWYCNDPENVARPEPLFAAKLQNTSPARLLYHHMNVSSGGLFIEIHAVNLSDRPARLLIIPGDAVPHKNPVFAGIEAADMFLRNWLTYSGEVITIPPKSSAPIALRRVAPQETMSGLAYLRLLDGGPSDLLVRADAVRPYQGDGRLAAALNSPAPWRQLGVRPVAGANDIVAFSDHVYPWPFRTEQVNYQVGGRLGFVRIGQRPIPNNLQERALEGNFGVIYTVEARLENPTQDSREIEIVFEASAGYSGALFVLNNRVIRTPLLQPKHEHQILKVRLEPGAVREYRLMTIPLSGSSYPSTITIRPTDIALR